MTCTAVGPDLTPYHRGELPAEERVALEAHLESCPACRADLEDLVEAVALVQGHVPSHELPPAMKEGALARVEAERVGALLRHAGVHDAPAGLKARALAQVAAADDRRTNVRRLPSRIGRATLAAAAVIAVLFAFAYRSQVGEIAAERDRAEAIARRAEGQTGPAGHPVQTLTLAGGGVRAGVDLYHFRHDNYRLVLDLEEMPVTPPGHHYEVWLTSPAGEVSVGSFRIKADDRFTNAWVVGVDPADFPDLFLTVERNDGDPSMSERVLARASIDPNEVRHGSYDE